MSYLLAAVLSTVVGSSQVAVAPTHPASCAVDQSARIVEAVPPEYPPLAVINGLSGKALIRVDISETGHVVGSWVRTSSGSGILDQAALRAVNATVYAPETKACTSIAGSYGVEVEFAQ
jgi:protein TonB